MHTTSEHYPKYKKLLHPLLYIFVLGAAIRFYNSWFTFYINSDGVLYINQAKVIYFGRWGLLPSIDMPYLANYPFFIAGAYAFLKNWLLAAKATSFVFGSLTLVPLYFLFRRYFNRRISALGMLLYAFIPVFVTRSADVIRDPVYWFFVVSGMYLFTLYKHPRYQLYLVLSNLSFLMATWARIEAFLFILVTACYLLLSVREGFKRVLSFLAPVLFLSALVFSLPLFTGFSLDIINRVPEIVNKLAMPLQQYQGLGADVEALRRSVPIDAFILNQFLDKANNFAWLVALATLFNHFLEGFYHPFCLVLLVGIPGAFARFKEEPLFGYFLLMIVAGGGLVYSHLLLSWNVDSRFLAIAMLPMFIYIGHGFEKIVIYFKNRYAFDEAVVMAALCILVLLVGIPKNIYHRETDKLVFKEIGEYVARREVGNTEYIPVSSAATIRQFAFYANSNNPDLIFPNLTFGRLDPHCSSPKTYKQFLIYFKCNNIRYFLWEEKFWARQPYKVLPKLDPEQFLELKHWYHPDTGKMVLFEVMPLAVPCVPYIHTVKSET